MLAVWLALICLLSGSATVGQALAAELPVYDYQVIKSYPHNPQFFTHGLYINFKYLEFNFHA
jgi:glutamine cyclotransferase